MQFSICCSGVLLSKIWRYYKVSFTSATNMKNNHNMRVVFNFDSLLLSNSLLLQGSICGDCCMACWCPLCSMCQMSREQDFVRPNPHTKWKLLINERAALAPSWSVDIFNHIVDYTCIFRYGTITKHYFIGQHIHVYS